jgi:hypothetical protein
MLIYPYLQSNAKIKDVFSRIQAAAKPPRFTVQFMRDLGFTSSNDQSYPGLLKKLGFLSEDGVPNLYYDQLRDLTAGKVLAERIKATYKELFEINTNMNSAPDAEIKGAISRVTGEESRMVDRIFNTFKGLCSLADFSGAPIKSNSIHSAVFVDNPQKSVDQTSPRKETHANELVIPSL